MPPLVCQRIEQLAERNPGRAVPLARRAYGQTDQADSQFASASYTLGWTLLCWERFAEARPHLQMAQKLFDTRGALAASLRCQRALLLTDLAQRPRSGLADAFAALTDRCTLSNMLLEGARVQIDHARLMNVLGRSADAEALLAQAEPIIRAEPIDRARWLRACGVTAYLKASYGEARELLTAAERDFTALRLHVDIAKCWLELATVAFRQEQLDRALADYRRAEALFARLDTPLQRAFCVRNIGGLLIMRGAYDEALGATLTALAAFSALERHNDIGGCHLHLGNIYFHTGRWEAARASYLRAESCYVTAGAPSHQLIARRNRAMVSLAQRQYDAARSLLATVEEQAFALNNQAELAEIMGLQAALLAEEGARRPAAERYEEASRRFAALRNEPGVAECQLEQAWLLIADGEPAAAQSLLAAAEPALSQHPHHHWRVAYGFARCADAGGDRVTALGHYRSASATVAKLRGRLTSEAVSSSLYQQAAQLHDDALACAAAAGQIEELLALSEGQRALILQRSLAGRLPSLPPAYQRQHDLLRERISSLLTQDDEDAATTSKLDRTLDAYGDLLLRARHTVPPGAAPEPVLSEQPFDLQLFRSQASSRYGAGWTALVYALEGEHLLVITVTPDAITLWRTPYDLPLRRLVERASQAEYQPYTFRDLPYLRGQTIRPWAILGDLGARLLPPEVTGRLQGDHRLLVVPTGPLHAIPWAALRLDDQWLAERAVVHVVPSLAVWQTLAARGSTEMEPALLLGCADFGNRAAALPNVSAELDLVASYITEGVVKELPAARRSLTERSANGELAGYKLIHIASHAQLTSTRGLAAHIKLTDGDLLLPEIAMLRLQRALVTLSACDGAAADSLPGEEVLSLSRAFLIAGARGVLASLWPVYDAAVLHCMHRFYEALRQHGDAALALALAQRACIADYGREGDPRAEPLCWASFVYTGA